MFIFSPGHRLSNVLVWVQVWWMILLQGLSQLLLLTLHPTRPMALRSQETTAHKLAYEN